MIDSNTTKFGMHINLYLDVSQHFMSILMNIGGLRGGLAEGPPQNDRSSRVSTSIVKTFLVKCSIMFREKFGTLS